MPLCVLPGLCYSRANFLYGCSKVSGQLFEVSEMSATVFFSHGKESGPWGLKIRRLAKVAERFGCRVVSLDDQGVDDPQLRVRHLCEAAGGSDDTLILVGSSMGGYVAAVASTTLAPRGLFLMAPAVGLPGYDEPEPQPVADEMQIVHGWDDDIVPFEPVLRFAQAQACPFHLLPDGHNLQVRIDQVEELFAAFLSRCLANTTQVAAAQRLAGTL